MLTKLSLAEFKQLAEHNNNVVVYQEIAADDLTPTQVYAALANTATDITLLESNPLESETGRFSHLCFDPIITISAKDDVVSVTNGSCKEIVTQDPFAVLREYHQQLGCAEQQLLCKFAGGFVGYMSYDAIKYIEDIKLPASAIPDILFRYCKNHISFDHKTGNIMLATVVEKATNEEQYSQAIQDLDALYTAIYSKVDTKKFKGVEEVNVDAIATNISDDKFAAMIDAAKAAIVAGDVFQVVLSRKFSIEVDAAAFDIYRALRFSNPSPHMFFFSVGEYAFAGASPEKLVSLHDGELELRPLAGTRRRGLEPDAVVAADLLADEKEMAEHMMLVDLGRNDLGRVAVPGSVQVTKLAYVEYYARVMHIASKIQAQLAADKDVFDVLKATLPAGTLSGAPKVRAMELIAELEQSARGLYGGVVCGIDGKGNLDSTIAIRMAAIHNGCATVQAGAGVVFDSNAHSEAQETKHKARAILEGIVLAEEMV